MKNKKAELNATIFVNGPYQLLVGIACAKQIMPGIKNINVIPYDVRWDKDLSDVIEKFSEILGVYLQKLPIEFRKMDINTFKTHPIRSAANHLLFWIYCHIYCQSNIFLPKLFGSPERAIIFASSTKNVFIYDDGYGMYINPLSSVKGFNSRIMKYLVEHHNKSSKKIELHPAYPQFLTYDLVGEIPISKNGYSTELREIVKSIADKYQLNELDEITNRINDKQLILISLPRLEISDQPSLWNNIGQYIQQVANKCENTVFLIKPHPRDVHKYNEITEKANFKLGNVELLPRVVASIPLEVLARRLKPTIVATGFSTIGINQSLLDNTKILILNFLNYDLPNYAPLAKNVMLHAGSYIGNSLNEAIDETISVFLAKNLY